MSVRCWKRLATTTTAMRHRMAARSFATSRTRCLRFVQFTAKRGGPQHLGAQLSAAGDIFDISAVDSSLPNSLVRFLQAGPPALEKAKRIVAHGSSVVSAQDVNLLSPITRPEKVVCAHLNYRGRCADQDIRPPKEPLFCGKLPSTIVGPFDDVVIPPISNSVDWEVELAVVIGKQGKAITIDKVPDHIFGYTIAQDISARDWQMRNSGQFLLGKCMDTFCPLGPAVITKDALDVDNLQISCAVNGVRKQHGTTAELIFKVDFLISYLSQIMTLYAGDVILTGTPAGVGMYRKPQEFLHAGDVLESEIEGIGKMCNCIACD